LASAKNRFILLLILAVAVLAVFTGCGGGGGDGSGPTLDPDQLEVAAAVDAFSAAIRGEDFAAANSFPNSEVKWYRQDGTTWDNLKIQKSLKNFFDKATVKDFTISGIGVNMISDTVAESRGNLSLTYSDAAATDKKNINESIKMVLEKAPGGPWGLIEFGVYGTPNGSAFPPEL